MSRFRTFTITVALLLTGWSAIAYSPAAPAPRSRAQAVVDSIAATPTMRTAQMGVLAVTASGDTIAAFNHDRKFVPASNVKLITTGLALRTLGEDFRFRTTIAYSGSIEDGVLRGDLYIVGGGDPTTGSRASCATPLASLFGSWQAMLSKAGIRSIEGRVIGDARFMQNVTTENLGWTLDDLGTFYGVGPAGLNFFENAHNFMVRPGSSRGAKPSITQYYPQLPWLDLRNNAVTGPERSANTLYYINTNLAPAGEFAGSFPVDRKGYTFEGANRFGAYTCAWYFTGWLEEHGIKVKGGAADLDADGQIRTAPGAGGTDAALASDSLNVLGSTDSPSLVLIVSETNHDSNNFYAETLLKMCAMQRGYGTDERSTAKAAMEALAAMGLETSGRCKLVDGSGLSRKNYVSPSFFVDFLRVMDGSAAYLNSLPVPGGKGTLEYKFPRESDAFRSRIHLKSGSMDGVRCYSGYILSSDGDPSRTIYFSLQTNNSDASSWRVNPLIDAIIKAVALEN